MYSGVQDLIDLTEDYKQLEACFHSHAITEMCQFSLITFFWAHIFRQLTRTIQ